MPSCVRSGFSHFEMILSASATQRHVGERARTHKRGHMHDIQRHEGLGEKFTPPHSLHTGVSAPRTIKSRLICFLTRLLPPGSAPKATTHPSSLLRHPRGDVPLDDEPHGVDDAEKVLGVALPHAVHGQTSGGAVQRDDLAPRNVRLEQLPGDRAQHISHRLLTRYRYRNLRRKNIVQFGAVDDLSSRVEVGKSPALRRHCKVLGAFFPARVRWRGAEKRPRKRQGRRVGSPCSAISAAPIFG